MEGNSEQAGNIFVYRHKKLHASAQQLTEVVPSQRVVWLVTNSHLSFLHNKSGWTGTRIIFDIAAESNHTKLLFTHEGLVPAAKCYDACTNGWNHYLHQSLLPLITTGKGCPDKVNSVAESAAQV